ncbi:hypothetical protein QFZ24_003752 [Streptomyces phaeochromogenes]|nr:hypothetical protein [Streptomyces phaeochromogenes]
MEKGLGGKLPPSPFSSPYSALKPTLRVVGSPSST